jgi:hypothetical protein
MIVLNKDTSIDYILLHIMVLTSDTTWVHPEKLVYCTSSMNCSPCAREPGFALVLM